MPRYRDGFPRPKKEYHHGVWRIVWRWDGKKYSVATSISDENAISEIESYVRNLASQLAGSGRPKILPPWNDAKGVSRYIKDRFGDEEAPKDRLNPSSDQWLEDYRSELESECSERWAKFSSEILKKFNAHVGGIASATPDQVSTYLSDIGKTKKTATRNRILSIFSRFFKWAVRTERTESNPAAGIKMLSEERRADIVYCTPDEREEIIAMAKDSGRQEWMAIPIAFYAGLRREEIARLKWEYIRFNEGLIMAHITKTGKPRSVPLSASLEAILSAVPQNKRTGFVVDIPKDIDRPWRMDNLIRELKAEKEKKLLDDWGIPKPPPSRAKDYKEKKATWLAGKKKRDGELKAHLDRIGWNSFRHTFGSLVVQKKIASIDELCAWMGNTPEVCRRHYVQFIPRDSRNCEIDKL